MARRLARPTTSVFADGRAHCALHARRGDRGEPGDNGSLRDIVWSVARCCRDWTVVSDDAQAASALRRLLREADCSVAKLGEADGWPVAQAGARRTVQVGAPE